MEESINGYCITPYIEAIVLYAGQADNYLSAQKHIGKYLKVKADDSQINNLVSTYDEQLETEISKMNLYLS